MGCGRCGNKNPNTVPPTVSGGRSGSAPRPGTPTVVNPGRPTVRPSVQDSINSLRYVPNGK